jgi:hypothetical protein
MIGVSRHAAFSGGMRTGENAQGFTSDLVATPYSQSNPFSVKVMN